MPRHICPKTKDYYGTKNSQKTKWFTVFETSQMKIHTTTIKISLFQWKTCNDLNVLDRQVWADSVDPDQTAQSGSTLFAILSASFGRSTLW